MTSFVDVKNFIWSNEGGSLNYVVKRCAAEYDDVEIIYLDSENVALLSCPECMVEVKWMNRAHSGLIVTEADFSDWANVIGSRDSSHMRRQSSVITIDDMEVNNYFGGDVEYVYTWHEPYYCHISIMQDSSDGGKWRWEFDMPELYDTYREYGFDTPQDALNDMINQFIAPYCTFERKVGMETTAFDRYDRSIDWEKCIKLVSESISHDYDKGYDVFCEYMRKYFDNYPNTEENADIHRSDAADAAYVLSIGEMDWYIDTIVRDSIFESAAWYLEEHGIAIPHTASAKRNATGKAVAMKMDEREAFNAGFEAGMKSANANEMRNRMEDSARSKNARSCSARVKRSMKKKAVAGIEYRIFIGAVSEPTFGEWVDLPCDEEIIDEVVEKIQSAGFEEYFIPDYEGVYGYSAQEMEFKDPYELNKIISELEDYSYADDLPEEVYIALVGEYGLAGVSDVVDDVWYIEGDTYSDLAYNFVAEFGDLAEAVGKDNLERYFDYEAYGRDLAYDFNIHADGYFVRTGSQKKMCVCVKGKPIGCKAAKKASRKASAKPRSTRKAASKRDPLKAQRHAKIASSMKKIERNR